MPGASPEGLCQRGGRGTSVAHLQPRVAVASAIWDEKHTTTIPFLLPEYMPRGELPSVWSHLKKKVGKIITNFLVTSCHSYDMEPTDNIKLLIWWLLLKTLSQGLEVWMCSYNSLNSQNLPTMWWLPVELRDRSKVLQLASDRAGLEPKQAASGALALI